jgi:hypothetical protein
MPPDGPLTPAQSEDLRILAGIMIPASTEFDVPGADDPAIQADIVATLGRDTGLVREALDQLARLAGLALAGLDPARREAAAMALRAKGGAAVATLTRVVLQCYYRDDRVVRSLGLEPRPPIRRVMYWRMATGHCSTPSGRGRPRGAARSLLGYSTIRLTQAGR